MNLAIFQLRIMQIVFIVSVLLFIRVLHIVAPPPHAVNASLQWAIVFCAAVSALMGFIVQRMFLRFQSQSLSTAVKLTPLSPWFVGHILRFATAESVALFGFVLRVLGSSSALVYLLFGSSLLLLVLWQPGAIPTKTESQSSSG